jgi:ribonuclease HII
MRELHGTYPHYDFETHKGYVTASHTEALATHGPCPIHRRRFVNVRRVEGAGAAYGEAAEPLADNDVQPEQLNRVLEEAQ